MLTIRSLGHACYTLSDGTHTVIFDPWLTGNPEAACSPGDVRVDAVLPSHGHSDHLGDAIEISKRLNVPIIAVYELTMYCQRHGAPVAPMHIGGAHDFPFGRVKLTPAWHGSSVVGDDLIEYTGMPCGFVVTMDGRNVYYAGDTALFSDMKLIGELDPLEMAILPIGDNFTMGMKDAAKAAEFLQAKAVIPTHWSAFDVIKCDPEDYAALIEPLGIKCVILRPGEEAQF